MSQSSEQPLNGQQMQAVQVQVEQMARRLLSDIELRKLALRHACDIEQGKGASNVVKLAEQMHAFLTQGAGDSAKPNQV